MLTVTDLWRFSMIALLLKHANVAVAAAVFVCVTMAMCMAMVTLGARDRELERRRECRCHPAARLPRRVDLSHRPAPRPRTRAVARHRGQVGGRAACGGGGRD